MTRRPAAASPPVSTSPARPAPTTITSASSATRFGIMPAKLPVMGTPDHLASAVPEVREAVRAVLLDRDNRVLLFKAFPDKTRSRHFWITPGGGVTAGESPITALKRELTEECGLAGGGDGGPRWGGGHDISI